MRLLHLSDIHFKSPDCANAETDPTHPYRTRLARDVVDLCRESGRVDAILVGGDIAYKGASLEYEAAERWLVRLAEQCGCAPERIYVVPGNHDVDRRTCEGTLPVSNAQNAIAQAAGGYREREVRRQLSDPSTGAALFLPLQAYNDFAAKFDCSVYPTRPFWTADLPLGEGLKLKLFGLTSTLLSGLGNRDDAPGHLYLGRYQTVLDPDDDTVNLVLCHHPPQWFADRDDTEDQVNTRAQLQFFGHEHRQRCVNTPHYMRFLAGAVNPDPNEPGWRPGYNLVDLHVSGQGANRQLQVQAHIRQFQDAPEMFVPVAQAPGVNVWSQAIARPYYPPLGSLATAPKPSGPLLHVTRVADAVQAAMAVVAAETPATEAIVSSSSPRRLLYRFFGLTISQRRAIAEKLDLLRDDNPQIPDHERYTKALQEAKRRNVLNELAQEIELVEGRS